MRGFLGKIFLCMLLVPILARGSGMLLEATLSDSRPQSERVLAMTMPAMAALAAAELKRDGPDAVNRALAESPGLFRLVPASAGCTDTDTALAISLQDVSGFCLKAQPPPRALVLGFVPAWWRFLLPALELLCCGIVSFFLARYLAEPILRTRAAAAAFAAGDLSARTVPAQSASRRDEAADLEREFNRMADRVATVIASQHRFIEDVSHEIRSPLGRIALALGLAKREAGRDLAQRLDRMEHEMETLSRLVRELLVLASLEGGMPLPRPELIDLSDLLGWVIDGMAAELRDRGSLVRNIRPSEPVLVRGDSGLLHRAVTNVLQNAAFYSPYGTELEIAIDRDGGWARLVIRDQGPGVPESALPELFEPFFRVDESRARSTGGAGLGLAITHRVVRLHQGHIRAGNVRPHGLAVHIELPLADDQFEMATSGLAGDARAE